MAVKGAMGRDPQVSAMGSSTPTFKYAENKTAYQSLNPQQQNQYRNILAKQGRGAANEFLGKTSGQTVRMPGAKPTATPETSPTTPFSELSPTEQMNRMADVGGNLYQQMAGYSGQFNPQTFQQQYEPQFQQSMDKARQSVLNQFEQRNAQAFAKERQDFETAMANRGIAPGSQQYQTELQGLTDRQDRARQEAMNTAEQMAQGVQQQGFQQATGTAMLPGEIMGQYQAPVTAQYGVAASQAQLGLQQQYAKELAALENKYKLQQIKATPRGGGGGDTDPFQQYLLAQTMGRYDQQGPQQNPWATAAQGFAQGIGAGITANYLNPKGS